MRPFTAWVVVDKANDPLPDTLSFTEGGAIELYLDNHCYVSHSFRADSWAAAQLSDKVSTRPVRVGEEMP